MVCYTYLALETEIPVDTIADILSIEQFQLIGKPTTYNNLKVLLIRSPISEKHTMVSLGHYDVFYTQKRDKFIADSHRDSIDYMNYFRKRMVICQNNKKILMNDLIDWFSLLTHCVVEKNIKKIGVFFNYKNQGVFLKRTELQFVDLRIEHLLRLKEKQLIWINDG